jgi:hypothetical protein
MDGPHTKARRQALRPLRCLHNFPAALPAQ